MTTFRFVLDDCRLSVFFASHGGRVITILLEIFSEPDIFLLNCILTNVWEQEQGDRGRQEAQRAGNVEWILPGLDRAVASGRHNVGKDVRA